jgi:hypothetical protein
MSTFYKYIYILLKDDTSNSDHIASNDGTSTEKMKWNYVEISGLHLILSIFQAFSWTAYRFHEITRVSVAGILEKNLNQQFTTATFGLQILLKSLIPKKQYRKDGKKFTSA